MASEKRAVRRRSIRAMLAPLFIVPLVSLLALWGFAASVTLLSALREHNFTAENQRYGGQAQKLGLQLAQERLAVFVWLSSKHRTPATTLRRQEQMTDATVGAFQHGVKGGPSAMLPASQRALVHFDSALGRLGTLRAEVGARQITALGAFEAYNKIINAQFGVYGKLIMVNDTNLYQQASASLMAGRAIEMADREVTLVNGALAGGGHMTKGERVLFAETVAQQRLLIDDALKQLSPDLAAGYRGVFTSPAYKQFSAMENRIVNSIGSGRPIPVSARQWTTTAFSLLGGFQNAEQQDRVILAHQGTDIGDKLLLQVLLAGGLGLVAVSLSAFLMFRFGRRIIRELTGLQRSAQELAGQRLPRVVELLSQGEDIDTSPSPPATGRIAEIAKVAEAFTAVQSTAVQAAAGQASLRRGVSQVFRNLAWRSQALLHRQLALLDRMEHTATDPTTLEELFQLDHLTTRMRRHAEGLIILSGEAPGRGWRDPVPVVDVLRAAIAEVEDYTRVGVLTRNIDAVIGSAVADLIHLLAELIENATTSSPANTEVTVRAERVAHGLVVEVEDRGLGMSDQDMALANERLANPPEFDLADSDKLGFFVVARLAARHDIKITLRMSPYGGVAAIVLLPHAITVTPDTTDTDLISAYPDPLALPAGGWQPATVPPPARLTGDPLVPDDAEDTLGLPKRVRYDDQAAIGEPDLAAGSTAEPGTPEEIGALVASLQQGWLGGRNQAVQPDDS